MTAYTVIVVSTVSEAIQVDADNVAHACIEALDRADTPNVSNRFEMAGDHTVEVVIDDEGTEHDPE